MGSVLSLSSNADRNQSQRELDTPFRGIRRSTTTRYPLRSVIYHRYLCSLRAQLVTPSYQTRSAGRYSSKAGSHADAPVARGTGGSIRPQIEAVPENHPSSRSGSGMTRRGRRSGRRSRSRRVATPCATTWKPHQVKGAGITRSPPASPGRRRSPTGRSLRGGEAGFE